MFINRQSELLTLKEFSNKKTASLIVITGRRRIGKSALIQELAKSYNTFFEFQGLAPNEERITNEDQLKNFGEQLSKQLKIPDLNLRSWTEAFDFLASKTSRGKKLILLDEISWMGFCDPTFLGKLKIAWDTKFKKNDQLTLVLCGSVSSWIINNILEDTNFVGRVSLALNLQELSLAHCVEFWGKSLVSNYEKLKILSVTGGIPRYLEEINPKQLAEKNISRICFSSSGFLFNEFNKIFKDTFGKRAKIFKELVKAIVGGSKTLTELCSFLNKTATGTISKYLDQLEQAGFIAKDYVYNFEGKATKKVKYRLKDNYVRFYLKYIDPNTDKIKKNFFNFESFNTLLAWNAIFGLQFENLVINNLNVLLERLGLAKSEVLSASPYYFKNRRNLKEGLQIDLLIQSKFHNFYLCEIKSAPKVGLEVINEVKNKISKFKRPKYFSVRPVLIYAGEISEDLQYSDFFYKKISISDLFQEL